MPASSSEARNRWRKRKREPLLSRKNKPQDDDEEDEEDDEDIEQQQQQEFEDDPHQPGCRNRQSDPGPIARQSEVLSEGGTRICDFPPVVKRSVNRPHPSVLSIAALERAVQSGDAGKLNNAVLLENVSHGQLQALSAVPADSPALLMEERFDGANTPSFVITPPPVMEGRGVVKRFWGNRVHVLPVHADWFSPNAVHRLERQVVPHFFSNKSPDHTPEKYMECRNGIVAKYMEDPEKRLSISDCQMLTTGIDHVDLTRIVRFLDHWGIINYCAAPNYEARKDGTQLSEDPNGDLHVPAAALKSVDSLIQFNKPKSSVKAVDVYPVLPCQNDDDFFTNLEGRVREELAENQCNSCSRNLPTVHYKSQKEVDVQLCIDCFHDGRFVAGHSSLDFLRVESTKDYGDMDGESWSEREIKLLLEATELYVDNWNEIADHVGSKSKAQCILQFIRLHVENAPLEKLELPSLPILTDFLNNKLSGRSHSNAYGDLAGSNLRDSDSESNMPFGSCENPVMHLVSFLSSAVGPRVAAACAHASLAVLSEEGSGGSRMNSESTHGGENGPSRNLMNPSQQKEQSSGAEGPSESTTTLLSAEKVRAAAKAGLSAAAMKAKLFADHEEREIQRLSANIINHQLKRLELKLKQFAEVETLLMKECEQVERARQRIAAERALTLSAQFGPAGATRPMALQGMGPSSLANNNIGNNRQQVGAGSSSQPFIAGYGNNQPVHHPHMSLMQQQQQQMYGLGPRLPLSAINPSSSGPGPGPAHSMFNNAGPNAQPTNSHPSLRPISGTKSGLG